MAQLPNYEESFIDPLKIRDYILSSLHPIGRFKASFFQKMGYTQKDWEQMISDIRLYHLPLDAKPVGKTKYGQKYEICGSIRGPNGRIVTLRSIWIKLDGEEVPRFITIYPEGE